MQCCLRIDCIGLLELLFGLQSMLSFTHVFVVFDGLAHSAQAGGPLCPCALEPPVGTFETTTVYLLLYTYHIITTAGGGKLPMSHGKLSGQRPGRE